MATETGFTAMNGSRINAATDEAVDMSNDSRRRSHTAGQNVGESESPNTEPGGTPKSTIALLVSYSGLSKDGAARVVEKLVRNSYIAAPLVTHQELTSSDYSKACPR